MNVTINNNRFQNYTSNNSSTNSQQRKSNPSFGALPVPRKPGKPSNFFNGISKWCSDLYDGYVAKLAKHIPLKDFGDSFLDKCTNGTKKSNLLFNHIMAVESLITSGMYMYKTLNNDKLDKDRKNTLAINQGLTTVISTAGAYALDKAVDRWWQNKIADYAEYMADASGYSNDCTGFAKAFRDRNAKITADNKLVDAANKEFKRTGVGEKQIKESLKDVKKFFEKEFPNAPKGHVNRVAGMKLLKTIMIFGFVYRYLVPVLVVPIANKAGDLVIKRKKEKEEAMKAQTTQPTVAKKINTAA